MIRGIQCQNTINREHYSRCSQLAISTRLLVMVCYCPPNNLMCNLQNGYSKFCRGYINERNIKGPVEYQKENNGDSSTAPYCTCTFHLHQCRRSNSEFSNIYILGAAELPVSNMTH